MPQGENAYTIIDEIYPSNTQIQWELEIEEYREKKLRPRNNSDFFLLLLLFCLFICTNSNARVNIIEKKNAQLTISNQSFEKNGYDVKKEKKSTARKK